MVQHSRVEVKYLVPVGLMQEILECLQGYLEPDPQTKGKRFYQVASTYFDNVFLDAFSNKMEGVERRIKLRLRTYLGTGVYFLEIKKKKGNEIEKYRFQLQNDELNLFEKGVLPANSSKWEKNQYQYLEFLWNRIQFIPSIYIVYDRYPFLSPFQPTLRVTLDIQNRYSQASKEIFKNDFPEKYFISPHLGILEIKSSLGIPRWILNLIQNYSLQQLSLSKYCLGIERYQKEFSIYQGE